MSTIFFHGRTIKRREKRNIEWLLVNCYGCRRCKIFYEVVSTGNSKVLLNQQTKLFSAFLLFFILSLLTLFFSSFIKDSYSSIAKGEMIDLTTLMFQGRAQKEMSQSSEKKKKFTCSWCLLVDAQITVHSFSRLSLTTMTHISSHLQNFFYVQSTTTQRSFYKENQIKEHLTTCNLSLKCFSIPINISTIKSDRDHTPKKTERFLFELFSDRWVRRRKRGKGKWETMRTIEFHSDVFSIDIEQKCNGCTRERERVK